MRPLGIAVREMDSRELQALSLPPLQPSPREGRKRERNLPRHWDNGTRIASSPKARIPTYTHTSSLPEEQVGSLLEAGSHAPPNLLFLLPSVVSYFLSSSCSSRHLQPDPTLLIQSYLPFFSSSNRIFHLFIPCSTQNKA